VLERLLEAISFEAADKNGLSVTVNAAYVDQHLCELVKDEDLTRYIL
jgi:ATP-dependent HslUV protease ATP-binding subunit HslU